MDKRERPGATQEEGPDAFIHPDALEYDATRRVLFPSPCCGKEMAPAGVSSWKCKCGLVHKY